MLGLLQDAVEEHNAEVAALLRERGGGKELRLIVETEDFGVTWRSAKWKLPAFAMCTGAARCVICHCGQPTTAVAREMPGSLCVLLMRMHPLHGVEDLTICCTHMVVCCPS